jgi:hypothetical protein
VKLEYNTLIVLQAGFAIVALVSLWFGLTDLRMLSKMNQEVAKPKKVYITNHMVLTASFIAS